MTKKLITGSGRQLNRKKIPHTHCPPVRLADNKRVRNNQQKFNGLRYLVNLKH